MKGRVFHLFDRNSLGIRRYSQGLAEAMEDLGWKPSGAHDADIWHVHYGNSSRLFAWMLRPIGPPIVLTAHDVLPRNQKLRGLVRASLAKAWQRRAAVTVVHNKYAMALMGGRAKVVPMYAFESRSASTPMTTAPLQVGIFGRFAAHKGLAWLQQALSGLSWANPIAITLCGQGAGQAKNQLNWPDITVIDNPDDRRFDQELARMDCIVAARLDSVGESSAVVPQALARGVAILYNCESALQNDMGAAGIEVNTPAELRQALLLLSSDRTCLADLRAKARAKGQTLSAAKIALQYDAIYTTAMRSA